VRQDRHRQPDTTDRERAEGASSPSVPGRRGAAPRALRALVGGRDSDSPVDLDRVIHERLRLGKLEEAGYITCTKGFEGRMPRSEYRLTHPGRKALERYLDHMDAIIRATRGMGSTEP
jgi:hypothetical protein